MRPGAAITSLAYLLLAAQPLFALEIELASGMSEEQRAAVTSVVVLSTPDPASKGLSGSYGEDTPGFIGGWNEGADKAVVDMEVGSVPIRVPIPILQLPAAIIGGISGAVKEQVQELRDTLTDELADAEGSPLTHDALAMDVFWNIRKVPGVDAKVLAPSVKIPEGTDAALFVNVENVTIDVDGKDAVLTIAAIATLRRTSDGTKLYESRAAYQDRDTLKNWTRDDSLLWKRFANFGRHYLGREIATQIFDRGDLDFSLEPRKSKSVSIERKDAWAMTTKSKTPELAWEHRVAENGDVGSVSFDVEIYDLDRPVYSAERVPGISHVVAAELECRKTYRWSVRPSYALKGQTRHGHWMRRNAGRDTGQGSVGVSASVAPAYLYDFAILTVKC